MMLQSLITQPPDPILEYAEHHPLLSEGPVRADNFWIDPRLAESPADVAYYAHADGSDPVVLIHLRDGVTPDPAVRARLSGEINAMHIDTVVARGGQDRDEGHTAVRFRDEDNDPIVVFHRPLAPRVALAFSGSPKIVVET